MRKFLVLLVALMTAQLVVVCEAVPVTEPRQKDVTTIEELYAKNREAEPEFHALMAELRDEFGAELRERDGLKSEARVREKAKKEYGGDYSLITDILAATLVLDTEGKILDAANELKSREYVVSFIDRWTKSRASGYRDFQLPTARSRSCSFITERLQR